MKDSLICAGCGARLQSGADICDLCGWSVTEPADEASQTDEIAAESRSGNPVASPNPVAVGASSTESEGSAAKESVVAARSAFLVAAAAALLVAGLYLITVVSRSQSGTDPAPIQTVDTTPPPLSGSAIAEEESLLAKIEAAEGLERVELQRALIGVYVRENRLDLAGDVQEDIAVAVNSEVEWVRSGNLYYDWMELQGSALRTAYARKAIASYSRALEINPNNLDARTDMALAYFYDPQRPMDAIRNITMVLEADSTHIQANYNRGYLLFQIGRYDQSVEQFEKVLRLVGNPEDPIYRRAETAIQTVRQRMSAS